MRKLFLSIACVAAFGVFAQGEVMEGNTSEKSSVNVANNVLQAQARRNILVLENKEKGYRFWMDNRVQFDGAYYFGLKNGMLVDGEPAMPGGVALRRVRMAAKVVLDSHWYGEVDFNLAGGEFRLKDAYIMYSGLRNFEFKAGNFKEDFSMEQTTSSRYTAFMERPMVVSTFSPGRHAGLYAGWHGVDWFRASAGVSWQAIEGFGERYNVNEYNKMGKGMGTNVTGKVVWMPWGSQDFHGLHIGYNASYRHAKKTDDNHDGDIPRGRGYEGNYFSTRNATYINRTKFIRSEYYGVKYDYLQGIELAGYLNGFRFQSEFIGNHSVMNADKIEKSNGASEHFNVFRPGRYVANEETKLFHGFYVHASYLLFGGKQYYDTSESEFKRPTRGRTWGDVELGLRYDYLTLNSKDIFGGSGENYTLGLTFHANDNVRMMLNYQYSRNDKYAGNNGTAVIGRDANGNYTTATSGPTAAVSDFGIRFNTIQARVEINF